MKESRMIRETKEYEDGTIEETVIRQKEIREFEAPKKGGIPWTMIGLLGAAGLLAFMVYKFRYDIAYRTAPLPTGTSPYKRVAPGETSETAPGGYWTPPSEYKAYGAPTPQPTVTEDEYVSPVMRSGRFVG